MTAEVIDLDKARMGRPSREHIELYRQAALEQRMEARVLRTETAQRATAVEPHLRRLELLAKATGAPTAIESVRAIRTLLTPPRTA